MKTRPPEKVPPIDAPSYGKSLRGLGFNLLVRNIKQSVKFHIQVLESTEFYSDSDFAALRLNGGEYMLHADHTYRDNPVAGLIAGVDARGIQEGLGWSSGFTALIPILPPNGRELVGGRSWQAPWTNPTACASR